MNIERITHVPIKEVWKYEDKHFTPWLRENIDILNEVLEIELSDPEIEKSVGPFSADLVAQAASGETVVIENQYGKSNHDHLGKLLTYMTNLEASAAVWIVEDAKAEHINAINWLNTSSNADFYLVKIEAVRIANSPPAPIFTVIVEPSEMSSGIKAVKKSLSETEKTRVRFWTKLLEKCEHTREHNLFSNVSPSKQYWLGTGYYGFQLSFVATKHATQVELYIDKGDKEKNKSVFEKLYRNKKAIENTYGEALIWQKLEGKQACRISKSQQIGGYSNEDKWEDIFAGLTENMTKFRAAIEPFVKELRY